MPRPLTECENDALGEALGQAIDIWMEDLAYLLTVSYETVQLDRRATAVRINRARRLLNDSTLHIA